MQHDHCPRRCLSLGTSVAGLGRSRQLGALRSVAMVLAFASVASPAVAQSTCAEALAGTSYVSNTCVSNAPEQSFGPMDYCMTSNAGSYPDGFLAWMGMGWRCNGGVNQYRVHTYWCMTPGAPFIDCATPSAPPAASSPSDGFCDAGSLCVKAYGWLRQLVLSPPDPKRGFDTVKKQGAGGGCVGALHMVPKSWLPDRRWL